MVLPGIKGDDDRVTVRPVKFPWTAIGRLNRRTGGFCTATVIGPKLILTAAHCLWNKRTRRYLPPISLHFVAGWARGDYLFHAKAAQVRPSPNYKPGIKTLANTATDWALIVLTDDPVPVTGAIEISDNPPAPGTPLIQAGYSQDRAHVLTVHRDCGGRVSAEHPDLLLHNCDAVRGDSGSPVMVRNGDKFRLVAVHVATGLGSDSKGLAVIIGQLDKAILPR